MKVSELQPRQGSVNLELEIVSKEEPREFEKFGKTGRVCNAKGKDDSGEIKLTLWNEQIDQIKVGDKVKMENGYVGEWHSHPNGSSRLSSQDKATVRQISSYLKAVDLPTHIMVVTSQGCYSYLFHHRWLRRHSGTGRRRL